MKKNLWKLCVFRSTCLGEEMQFGFFSPYIFGFLNRKGCRGEAAEMKARLILTAEQMGRKDIILSMW